MNNEQIKYARQRLQDLYSSKKNALNTKFNTVGVKLTTEQKIAALKAGEYTVLDTPDKNSATYYEPKWSAYIRFNGEIPAQHDAEGYKKAETTLKTAYTAAMDELMLGDSEEAVKLIKAFEAI